MLVLGINAFHADSAACLVRDGEIIAAVEEERLNRIKHWAGFPENAIEYCLREAGVTISELDIVAINTDPAVSRYQKIRYAIRNMASPSFLLERIKSGKRRGGIGKLLKDTWPEEIHSYQLINVEHHMAHLYSAFYPSKFEKAIVLSIDGFGDFASACWGIGTEKGIELDQKVFFPDSLGIFYQAVTQYLGFNNYGDEYKVMGLAPYGEPKYASELRQLVKQDGDGVFNLDRKYFSHWRTGFKYSWENGTPEIGNLFTQNLEKLLGPARQPGGELEQKHKDIARSAQLVYEEIFIRLVNALYEKYQIDKLALAGGCAMNSVANGKVLLQTKIKQIYIQPAAGDAGGALGAALASIGSCAIKRSKTEFMSPYLGPGYTTQDILERLLGYREKFKQEEVSLLELPEQELYEHVVSVIIQGGVVGWFQGRLEWGPRALGNRSILGDPRRADMKDILNRKIKRRESFRPFAPSVLSEEVGSWFEVTDEVPYMMKVYNIKSEKRTSIPAVTHVDGSGRLQTVTRSMNERYHGLISCFFEKTGVPMLLNTSFNENEPIVCDPREAIDCFLRTKMDLLILGNIVVGRSTGEADKSGIFDKFELNIS